MHHVPALFLHPSRRLRNLALTAHAEVLRAGPLRAQMSFYLREVASAGQVECILGSWCMATRDVGRDVALMAQRSWDTYVSLAPVDADADADADAASIAGASSSIFKEASKEEVGDEDEDGKLVLDATQMAALFVFVQRALLDPLALHAYLNPVQVPVDIAVPRAIRGRPVPTASAAAVAQTRRTTDTEPVARVKGESEEESETDRKARLRTGALGVLQWILGTCATFTFHLMIPLFSSGCAVIDVRSQIPGRRSLDDLLDILSDVRLWSSLYHAQTCPFADVESFGYAQPGVRSYAWALLQVLLEKWPGTPLPATPLLADRLGGHI